MHAEIVDLDEGLDLRSLWQELALDPGTPERFELTEHGEVVLSPLPTNRHQSILAEVSDQLKAQLAGRVLQNPAVLTRGAGVRCPDVAWLPEARKAESLVDGPMEAVPPLVVEVLSSGNRKPGMAHKIRAYLDSGAEEVIVIGLEGSVAFHRADGIHRESVFGVQLTLAAELFAR